MPLILLGLAAAFCAVRSILDFRAKRYSWAAAGALVAAIILMTPAGEHSVTLDLPAAADQ